MRSLWCWRKPRRGLAQFCSPLIYGRKKILRRGPPTEINDCLRADEAVESRPIKVDLFIATYSEDVELVRLSIRDAMQMTYLVRSIIKCMSLTTGVARR